MTALGTATDLPRNALKHSCWNALRRAWRDRPPTREERARPHEVARDLGRDSARSQAIPGDAERGPEAR